MRAECEKLETMGRVDNEKHFFFIIRIAYNQSYRYKVNGRKPRGRIISPMVVITWNAMSVGGGGEDIK